ncbi:MAG: hypothetical protein AAGF32_01065 [Pseudomonadota bacterium]
MDGTQGRQGGALATIFASVSIGVLTGAVLGAGLAKAPATVSIPATFWLGAVLAIVAATCGLLIAAWCSPAATGTAGHDADDRGPVQAMCAGAFGASAFALGYSPLGPHAWFHAHQYAIGAAVIALGAAALLVTVRLGSGGLADGLRAKLGWLNACFGLLAAGGVTALVLSGKLELLRKDWPANVIFITVGSWLALVSLRFALQRWLHRAR